MKLSGNVICRKDMPNLCVVTPRREIGSVGYGPGRFWEVSKLISIGQDRLPAPQHT